MTSHIRTRAKRRGVSLPEIAIVLAIIGAAVAALFAGASIVTHKVNLNKASDELAQTSQNMQNIFAGKNTAFANLTAIYGAINANAGAGDFAAMTSTFMQQGAFPNDMISPGTAFGAVPCAGAVANHPFSQVTGTCGGNAVGSAQVALAGTAAAGTQYVVRYITIDDDSCADLLIHNSTPGRETNLLRIRVNNVDAGIFGNAAMPLPMTSVAAANICTNGLNNIIDWYYKL